MKVLLWGVVYTKKGVEKFSRTGDWWAGMKIQKKA